VHPAWLNPALTGAFDGEYRAAAIYRNQWSNVSSPFSTIGASLEFTTPKNLNLGVNILNQRAGDGGYNYTTAYGNAAFTGIRMGVAGQHRVVLALQAGLIQRRFNPSKLTFGDQWNPVLGYNSGNATAEVFGRNSNSSFDAGAGALYFDATPGKKANLFGGFAVSHLTRPADQFASKDGKATVPVRYTAHAGVRLQLSDILTLTPNALYLKQGNAEEKMLGTYAQLQAAANTSVLLGVNYRLQDAIAVQAGFAFDNMVFSASYDINTSDLGKMVQGVNSFEISLSFTGRKKVKTPTVEFVCPRL
jgi:type IX secretion system PorP/SprF family membrane protein